MSSNCLDVGYQRVGRNWWSLWCGQWKGADN